MATSFRKSVILLAACCSVFTTGAALADGPTGGQDPPKTPPPGTLVGGESIVDAIVQAIPTLTALLY